MRPNGYQWRKQTSSFVIGAIESIDFGYSEMQEVWEMEAIIAKDWKIIYATDKKASEIPSLESVAIDWSPARQDEV